jgi:hypothetical protein
MPQTDIRVFKDAKGRVEFNDWLKLLKRTNPGAYVRCLAALLRLERDGFNLRRPAADLLRGGIWELRVKVEKVNYRILYGFHGKNAACISHGITKEDEVPNIEINRAIERLKLVREDPQKHLAFWEK